MKAPLTEEELEEFDEASKHDEDCYCGLCVKWHEIVGEEV